MKVHGSHRSPVGHWQHVINSVGIALFAVIFGRVEIGCAVGQQAAVETRVSSASGCLVLAGGGDLAMVYPHFRAQVHSAEPKLVVVPTALSDAEMAREGFNDSLVSAWQRRGFHQVHVLHTRDRQQAQQEEFLAPLRACDAVWFTGGRQWRLADSYLGTAWEAALHQMLARGGVIGGTSAGATILGSFLMRGDTRGNHIVIGDHTRGFGLLTNSAIDQHWLARQRQADLTEVRRVHPHLTGIGIDESTAVVMRGGEGVVVGQSCVALYTAATERQSPPYRLLRPGDRWLLEPSVGEN